jgi:hypothetical protein
LETATFDKDLINVFLFPTSCTHTSACLPLTHAFLTLFVTRSVLRQYFLVFAVIIAVIPIHIRILTPACFRIEKMLVVL